MRTTTIQNNVKIWSIIALFFLNLALFSVFLFIEPGIDKFSNQNSLYNGFTTIKADFAESEFPLLSDSPEKSNLELITETLNKKIAQYDEYGYFNQSHIPSLQATYFALSVLQSAGKLDLIESPYVVDFVMDYYDPTSSSFSDLYTLRYFRRDESFNYFPYTTQLQTTCYGLLSLEILNSLESIDEQAALDFIWSCYNPYTSGFLGQPFDSELTEEYLIATMDNTYYALLTLDKLIDDWAYYSSEKAELQQFIGERQAFNGGFRNDNSSSIDTSEMFEPNVQLSYYSVKSLEIIEYLASMRVDDLKDYLLSLYNEEVCYFKMAECPDPVNSTIIPATAMALEIADIIGLTEIDQQGVLDFLFENRNQRGTWSGSNVLDYCELIDAFQVVRSLDALGEIGALSANEKTQIVTAILTYEQHNKGFALLPNDYTTIELFSVIARSFNLFERTSELDLQGIYEKLESVYIYSMNSETWSLFECTSFDSTKTPFRSYPIEYYNTIGKKYSPILKSLDDHKATYWALTALQDLYKLDDFEVEHDLLDLLDSILTSQFLAESETNFGGFLPSAHLGVFPPQMLNNLVDLTNAYYAVRSLDFISKHLGMGNASQLEFDKDALWLYIFRSIRETSQEIYYDHECSEFGDEALDLEFTYYAAYLLKTIGRYNLIDQKIINFAKNRLDYSNLKSVYYCYKIFALFGYEYEFNLTKTHHLIESSYNDTLGEFIYPSYDTSEPYQGFVDYEPLFWVCELAKKDPVRFFPQYPSEVVLGSYANLTVNLCNIFLEDFGPYSVVKFESEQTGTIELVKAENATFYGEIYVPVESKYSPKVSGYLRIYDKSDLIGQMPIEFNATYNLIVDPTVEKTQKLLEMTVNVSRGTYEETFPTYECRMYANIYKNEQLFGVLNFTGHHFDENSEYRFAYILPNQGEYRFDVHFEDPFSIEDDLLFSEAMSWSIPSYMSEIDNNDEESETTKDIDPLKGIGESFIIVISVVGAIMAGTSGTILLGTKFKSRSLKG
ncbi:MAG: hypothetical protein GF383_14280 [Candidatus Lokiarchaeota archaeon]|nr:hypothetical protein [Candidatus Lokiarchaeota archaeon]MBD3342535.1 hypothetical protein [Candidatus Lokiarchaeota archaeon]